MDFYSLLSYLLRKDSAITMSPGVDTLDFHNHEKKFSVFVFENGAGSRTRTDTILLPRDFKSLASTNYAIPAYLVYFFSSTTIYIIA